MAIFSNIGKFLKEKIIKPINSFFSSSNEKMLLKTSTTKPVESSVDTDISYVTGVFTNQGFRFAERVTYEIDRRNSNILQNASVEQLKSYREQLEKIEASQQTNTDDTIKRMASSLDSRLKNNSVPVNKVNFENILLNVVFKLNEYETKRNSPCELMDSLWHYTTPFNFFRTPNQDKTNSSTKADAVEKQPGKTSIVYARMMCGFR